MTSPLAADAGSEAHMVKPTLKPLLSDSGNSEETAGAKSSNADIKEMMMENGKLVINLPVPASGNHADREVPVPVEDDDVVFVSERRVRRRGFRPRERRVMKEAGSTHTITNERKHVDLQGQGFTENNAETPNAAEFIYFRKFPAELRLKIWECAMPGPRVIEIVTDITGDGTVGPRFWTVNCDEKVPILFYVCQESRSEILKNYQQLRGNAPKGKMVYWDPRIDAVAFTCYRFHHSAQLFFMQCPKHILAQIRHIILGAFLLGRWGRWGRTKEDFAPLTGLKQIDFAVTFEATQPTVIGFIDEANSGHPMHSAWEFGKYSTTTVRLLFFELQRTDPTIEMPQMRIGKWAMGGDVLYRRNNGMRAVGW